MTTPLTLVVLAAGMGSRYGGLKQLEAVGPAGETLMDYSLFDALRAGFARAVFVIRPDMEDAFHAWASGRFGTRMQVATAHQRLGDLPAGVALPAERKKPWGTAHAVLAAAAAVDGPFAVVNADDFYGRPAYEAAARFLREEAGGTPATWGLVGYRLADTLSEAGGVNRGVCRADAHGWLTAIEEVNGIVRRDAAIIGRAGGCQASFADKDPVSMNFWAFTPAFFDDVRAAFAGFARTADLVKDELLIPAVIQDAVGARRARVRVLASGARWIGMTYPADRPLVERELRALIAAGAYPASLWS